jgi:2-polyprenyl-6-methoxyphenol hydroxylase-like FAD-dependent oxidoreductase
MMAKTDCVIAGGGPAGIMLGYLLARAGHDVTVLEKWPDFFRDFRGDTMHPSTMEVLRELGLLDEFLKLRHSEMTRMVMHVGDKPIVVADFTRLKVACPFIAFIPQWDFLNFLATKAKAFPTFHLLMETEAVDVLRDNGRVTGVRAKRGQEEFEIPASLVVGADGRHSTLREKGGFQVENLGAPIDVLWFRINRQDTDNKESLAYVEPGRLMILLDRHDYWQCAMVIEKDSFEAVKAKGLEAFRASVASLAHLPAATVAEVDSWDKVKLLSVTVDHVREWAKEGLVLIGDAAHAMSPIGGVGINYAIQDAVAAANILIPALRAKGPVPLDVLNRIPARRRQATRRMQRIQVYLQDHVMAPLLHKQQRIRVPFPLNVLARLPFLRSIPARILGIGFLPEHVDRFET